MPPTPCINGLVLYPHIMNLPDVCVYGPNTQNAINSVPEFPELGNGHTHDRVQHCA